MIRGDLFIPENDINETLVDGRLIVLASAGVSMSLHLAQLRGFVKGGTAGPDETKVADDVDADCAVTLVEGGTAGPDEQLLPIGSATRNPKVRKTL